MKFYQLLSTSCLLEVLIFWRILNLNRLPTKTNKISFFKHYRKHKVNKKRVKKRSVILHFFLWNCQIIIDMD